MKYQQYVVGFAFGFNETQVVLIEKLRPDWQKGKFNGVGGHIEENESPFEAMKREFNEEAGVLIDTWQQFSILKGKDFCIYFFRTEIDNIFGRVSQKTDERIQKFLVDHLPDNIIGNLKWLIPMAHSSQRKDWSLLINEEEKQ